MGASPPGGAIGCSSDTGPPGISLLGGGAAATEVSLVLLSSLPQPPNTTAAPTRAIKTIHSARIEFIGYYLSLPMRVCLPTPNGRIARSPVRR